jgi:MinD superfamily P-loop ATPase
MNRKDFISKITGLILLGGFSLAALADEPKKDRKKYTVLAKRCDGCGHCCKACRDKALMFSTNGKASIDPDKCNGCGECTRFCRRMAIVEVQ